MFNNHQDLSTEILRERFVSKTSPHNFCRNEIFERRQVQSVYHATESLSFLGPKIYGFSASGNETIRGFFREAIRDSFK